MTLAAQITALANRIGQEIKTLVRPDHPGLARAWCNFGVSNSTLTVGAAHNVASVVRLQKGSYRITFATPFLDDNYCWVAQARSSSSSTIRVAATRSSTDAKTPELLEIVCTSSAGALADSTEINLIVYH